MVRKRLGEVLREREQISAEQLEKTLADQRKGAELLGELLLKRGLVPKDILVSALEEIGHYRYVDPRLAAISKDTLELIPYELAIKYCAIPLARTQGKLTMAMAQPQNLQALDELQFAAGIPVVPMFAFQNEIREAIDFWYTRHAGGTVAEPAWVNEVDITEMEFFTAFESERNKAAIQEFQAEMRRERTPAVRFVSAMIAAASLRRASDIHIEPQTTHSLIRIRVDGLMRELAQIPPHLATAVVSRIKILADMDIAERRNPQDGRFLVKVGESFFDVRVSTLPIHGGGEKVAMRLLGSAANQASFTDLGLSSEAAATLNSVLALPQGMLIVSGPTGSGKSTTLYAALNLLRKPSVHIITVEDPVEYQIEGINQVQINPKAGLTFASCLRSILRQDPNVIMVGEIRDMETAEIALQAAQTGHLVLSTLHTNDSVSAITRLLDLGIPGFLISASVTAVMAQRLVRRLCSCSKAIAIGAELRSRFRAAGVADFETIRTPVGCPKCDHTGYKGRVGVYELLVLNDQIRAAMRANFADDQIRELARSQGMKLMQEDVIDKVKKGITSVEEAFRVLRFGPSGQVPCPGCGKSVAPGFLFCPLCGTATCPREELSSPGALTVHPV
jgi:type IV pilus assembly protein PilB